MVVLSKILPLVALGAGLLFAANIFSRPAAASASARALGESGFAIGSSLSSVGTGASHLGGGIGQGLAGLLQPFWEIKNLLATPIFDSNVAGSANISSVAQSSGETNRGISRPTSNTITWSGGTTSTSPSTSANISSTTGSYGGGHISGSVGSSVAGWGI